MKALALITLEYARLEHFISALIWSLVAADIRVGQTITANLMFRNRVLLLRSLFRMLPSVGVDADVSGLETLMARAEAAVLRRNDIVHALAWGTDEAGELMYSKLKSQKKSEPIGWVNTPASAEVLSNIASDLYECAAAVADFQIKHFGTKEFPPPDGSRALYGPRTGLPKTFLAMNEEEANAFIRSDE